MYKVFLKSLYYLIKVVTEHFWKLYFKLKKADKENTNIADWASKNGMTGAYK